MKKSTIADRLTLLLLAVMLSASPLIAQQKRGATPRKPTPAHPATQPAENVPTFDTLLADDSYKIYCEVRGVGQLLHSPAVNDLLEPLFKFGGPPKEFRTVLKWLEAHADGLAGSRMLVASWPKQTKLPAVLMAIEFSSPEEAQKFEPELRRLMPILAPTPVPTPAPSTVQASNSSTPQSKPPEPSGSPALPYHITHVGSLVLLSDKAFAFRDLKPSHAKLLAEDPNFATARNRFSSESLFLYVDVKAIEKEDQERRKKMEEEQQRRTEEEANRPTQEQTPEVEPPTVIEPTAVPNPEATPAPPVNDAATLAATEPTSTSATSNASEVTASAGQDSQLMNTLMYSFYGALFGGEPNWSEAIAAAVAFEGDAYVVRALILNSGENKAIAIPFLPQFVSGPALVPQSPGVLPAASDLFISASLDYPQIYDGLLKTIARMNMQSRQYSGPHAGLNPPVSPFADYEKKLGLKIKDDILPLLGNEMGMSLLPKSTNVTSVKDSISPDKDPPKKVSSDPDPVVAIAVKDKDTVRSLIPKLIESLGFKGAELLAQTERKDDTEITTYANVLSYAFVGDFLVLSPNPDATKRAVASYLNGETLSANSHFRNASGWQSRQVLAQVYMAPALVQKYGGIGNPANPGNDKMAELLSRLNPGLEPLTYSLSNEGSGPLHELHMPKNLLLLMLASMSNDASVAPLKANEAAVKSELRTLVSAEATYQATTGDGRYGTLDELVNAGLISKKPIERYGYEIELRVSANKYEATAVPLEYGKSGNFSYFVDESAVMRGGDHAGGPATISDPPIE